jgi:hypothetical protein
LIPREMREKWRGRSVKRVRKRLKVKGIERIGRENEREEDGVASG